MTGEAALNEYEAHKKPGYPFDLSYSACEVAFSALRERKNGGWISVKDRLPGRNQYVIGYFPAMAGTPSEIQITVGWNMDIRSAEGGWGAALWQPLPLPPEEE